MFNDQYGLTQAVLEGRKTMTRRICSTHIQQCLNIAEKGVLLIPVQEIPHNMSIEEFADAFAKHTGVIELKDNSKCRHISPKKEERLEKVIAHSPYKLGEVVAVAQSYKQAYPKADFMMIGNNFMTESAGWNNKMFVRADLMPHLIRITNIKVERLQDITDEACLKEGIFQSSWNRYYLYTFTHSKKNYHTTRDAFAAIIDRISGKGTWESNPWAFAYDFELVQ